MSKRILHYRTATGVIPYRAWFDSLKDKLAKAHIRNHIDRAQDGNFGKHRSVGGGVVELKIDFGPGYRVYLGQDGNDLIILLSGGDKSTQDKDVRLAQEYWQDYRRRK
jgi:putative addiction module killer protein